MDVSYTPQSEPECVERSYYWKTAIGLQQVDELTPSNYLIETSNANIAGKISLAEADRLITEYYEQNPAVTQDEKRQEEADKVSLRIAEILSEKAFTLSPVELVAVHKRLFAGIYDFAGKIRDYNISKREWVLGGETVYYAGAYNIRETLDYDFAQEKAFCYSGLDHRAIAGHIAGFISDLWQIHAFGEGNTRSIAVFAIKYLRMFGFDAANDTFEQHSKYFRNALVRANYNNAKLGITATREYLDLFFGNLLFGERNGLKSRELHIDKNRAERIKND
ncbi:MAG: Fic family protein [Oscillospiraceae bacterium]|jgi:fido (protein-threonine AMPylation protein)|nr:Fic family protein [Oscillospiraceae bacterium]